MDRVCEKRCRLTGNTGEVCGLVLEVVADAWEIFDDFDTQTRKQSFGSNA